MKYMIVQSMIWILFVFDARSGGFTFDAQSNFGLLKLRPHPQPVITIIVLLASQIMVVQFQQLKLAEVVAALRRLPTWMPLRKFGLRIARRIKDRQSGNLYKYFRPFKNYYSLE